MITPRTDALEVGIGGSGLDSRGLSRAGKIMSRRALWLLAYLITASVAAVAQGKECEGVTFPEQVQADGGTLTLNGLGLRQATFLKVDVYVAGLYVTKTSTDANTILDSNTPKELILHFVRDVDGAELSDGWDEGFENNAGNELQALKQRIDAFKAMMVDVKTGQRLGLAHKPGTGVRVDIDGTEAGTIEGDDFGRALFSIWLGHNPPNDDLKAGLLGGECE